MATVRGVQYVSGKKVLLISDPNLKIAAQNLDDYLLKSQALCVVKNLRMTASLDKLRRTHVISHSVESYTQQFCRTYPWYVASYGLACCKEYEYRIGKQLPQHALLADFVTRYLKEYSKRKRVNPLKPQYPLCVIPKDNGEEGKEPLYNERGLRIIKERLCLKWDFRKPKWTKREPPTWYHRNPIKESLKEEE